MSYECKLSKVSMMFDMSGMVKIIAQNNKCSNSEFDFFKDENMPSKVTCMCQTDLSKDNDLIFGFENGDVFFCSDGKNKFTGTSFQNKPKNIFTYGIKKPEGKVTSVIFSEKVFAWSTKDSIKAKYFHSGLNEPGNSICQIASPLRDQDQVQNFENFPEYHKTITASATPTIIFMKSIHDNYATLLISWYNEIRLFEL